MGARIVVESSTVKVTELEFKSDVVAHYLDRVIDEQRPASVARALEVGVFCLERVDALTDIDFVRSQIDRLLGEVNSSLQGIPNVVEGLLRGKIGTGEGQVLAPVQRAVEDAQKAVGQKIDDVKRVLSEDVDPKNRESTLGRALGELQALLDPKNSNSVQKNIENACSALSGPDGAIAQTVARVVGGKIEPFASRLSVLEARIDVAAGIEKALDETTKAGKPFEEELVDAISRWGSPMGVEVEYVGVDSRPGDIVVRIPLQGLDGDKMPIVVEAKHHQSTRAGRTPITNAMRNSISERRVSGGVYVCPNTDGLAREIGDWAEGDVSGCGPWVATVEEHLFAALRFTAALAQLKRIRQSQAKVDTHLIHEKVQAIRDSLQHITNINTSATKIETLTSSIREEAKAARTVIDDALASIEQSLIAVSQKAAAIVENDPANAPKVS